MNARKTIAGVHLFVYKPDRSGYTTVYCNRDVAKELLAYVGGNEKVLTSMARLASLRAKQKHHEKWSRTVIKATHTMLKSARAEAERVAAEAAARNNSDWEQGGAG